MIREDFIQWLESQPADKIVGINRVDTACPLLYFHKIVNPEVESGIITTNLTMLRDKAGKTIESSVHSYNSWHGYFIRKLDQLSYKPVYITAGIALEIAKKYSN